MKKDIRAYKNKGNQYATILDEYMANLGDSDNEKVQNYFNDFNKWIKGQPEHLYNSVCDAMASYLQGIPIPVPVWDDDIVNQFAKWNLPKGNIEKFHFILSVRIFQIADYLGIRFMYVPDEKKHYKVISCK